MEPGSIEKPVYGMPCNGCGRCCAQPCPAFSILHPGEFRDGQLCPKLRSNGASFYCGLYAEEENPERKEFIRLAAGIVEWGCDHVANDMDWERRKVLLASLRRRVSKDARRVQELVQILGLTTATNG